MMFHHDGLRTTTAENARTAHIIGQPLLIFFSDPIVESPFLTLLVPLFRSHSNSTLCLLFIPLRVSIL